jgi:hypothetical protein
MSRRPESIIGICIAYFILPIGLTTCISSRGVLTEKTQAVAALEAQGYEDIEIVDKAWFFVGFRGCGNDAARYTANVTNPRGKKVQVYVCVGWPFKGSTVRSQ